MEKIVKEKTVTLDKLLTGKPIKSVHSKELYKSIYMNLDTRRICIEYFYQSKKHNFKKMKEFTFDKYNIAFNFFNAIRYSD